MTDITCSMCGFRFDPAAHRGCAACPLQSGCQLACCPNCGFEAVDPNQSVLARAVARLFGRTPQEESNMQLPNTFQSEITSSSTVPNGERLTDLPPGTHARMMSFSAGMLSDRKAQLQAYGVTPGHEIWVRQQKPVTVIQVEHTELALESDLANSIYVEKLEPDLYKP